MAKTNGIGRRMADFYFEITDEDGETQTVGSDEASADEEEEEE